MNLSDALKLNRAKDDTNSKTYLQTNSENDNDIEDDIFFDTQKSQKQNVELIAKSLAHQLMNILLC